MKLTHVVYIFLLFILASCSNAAIVSNHWAKYVNSNPENTNLSSSLNKKPVNPIRLVQVEDNSPNKDSIIIVTKTGKTYKGIVSKSDYDGYFIKMEKNREIYIGNFDIKSIQFIKNPTVTNAQSLAIDPTLDTAIIKTISPIKKVVEPSNNNSLENDVWDNTNSEFEISNSATPQPVLQFEESSMEKVQEPLSILSFLFTLLGLITGIGFLLGMIFSAMSLSKIKKNPEKFKGKVIAKVSFVLSTIGLVAFLVLLLIFIAIIL
tara:strand:- start:1861 stop:2649 length:789 start_codon:yes stop_codon:yes gene_type:complete